MHAPQNEEESLWMRAEHIACLAWNPWASWQMQECLAPLSLRLMAFASSENAPETSTRLDPWHPAEKM